MNRQDIDIIRGHIDVQLAQVAVLHAKLGEAKRESADGYPRRSLGDGVGRESERDEDGTPLPARPADPTAAAVIARSEGHAGQISAALRQLESAVFSARKVLESAIGRAVSVLEPPKEPPVPVREDVCLCCENAVSATEVQKEQRVKRWGRAHVHAELCDWCATFVVIHGRRPPRVLLAKRESGKRIYDRDISEALGRRAG